MNKGYQFKTAAVTQKNCCCRFLAKFSKTAEKRKQIKKNKKMLTNKLTNSGEKQKTN